MDTKLTFIGLWIACTLIWQIWVSGIVAPILGLFTSLIATNGMYIGLKGIGDKHVKN